MIKKTFILLLFLILFQNIFSIDDSEFFEESFIQIKVDSLKDEFFMTKYNPQTNKFYIGLNSLFQFLELYSLEIDYKKLKVKGYIDNKKIYTTFNKDEAFVAEDELFIEFNSLYKLGFKNIDFDFSTVTLNLEPDFTLPYEEREQSNLERIKLNRTKDKSEDFDIAIPKKFFNLGFLKFSWDRDDIKTSNSNLSYEYSSQLLYGEFYLNGKIQPEHKLNYGNLTYHDFWKENDLILGNFSMITPNFINLDENIIGLSLKDEDTYMTRNGGVTTIKGEAEDAELIELYRNSTLLDYLVPQSKNFIFTISDGILNSDYTLKIYYKNGKLEEKKVFSLTDLNLLKKGKSKIIFQIDKDLRQKLFQGYYGINEYFTLGSGFMDLTSYTKRRYQLLQNTIVFDSLLQHFPTLVTYKNYYELSQKEMSYNLNITQKLNSYDLKFTKEQYSKYIYEDSNIKNYSSFSLGKNFTENNFELGVNKKVFYEDKLGNITTKNIYASWYTSYFNPISFSLKLEKDLLSDYSYNIFYPSISYSGIFTAILDGEIGKEKHDKNYVQNYNLRVNKRDLELIKNKLYMDLGTFIRYSNLSEKFRFGFSFNIKLDDLIYLTTHSTLNINENKDKTAKTSIRIDKIIALSSPLTNVENNSQISSSWIYGTVFLDKNTNGIFDFEDELLPNVDIIVDNKSFSTDKNGKYIATDIPSNRIVTLKVDRKTLDPILNTAFDSLKIKTVKASTLKLDIPIEVISIISGNILLNNSFDEQEFMKAMSYVTITLLKDDKKIYETSPDFDGLYIFENVLPGKYKINFSYSGKKQVKFSKNDIQIDITSVDFEEGGYFENYNTEIVNLSH